MRCEELGREDHAEQETQREEREAVREAEGKGDVEGARCANLELAGLVEPGWKEVTFGLVTIQLEPGRHDSAEEGRRPQGRQGHGAEELSV
jgi:hypothetical protein